MSNHPRGRGESAPVHLGTVAARSSRVWSARQPPPAGPRRNRRHLGRWLVLGAAVGAGVAALAIIFVLNMRDGSSTSGGYLYQVGKPGPGEQAPPIQLPSTDGSTFSLASLHGQTVLLYFQEGVMCEPCWTQIKDIQAHAGDFQSLGIDKIVSITTDSADTLRRKAADEGISLPVLSDANLAVSKAYSANLYGMMGEGTDGHSFILINKDGVIAWRADYGGAPAHTMYVPVPQLLGDIRKGVAGAPR